MSGLNKFLSSCKGAYDTVQHFLKTLGVPHPHREIFRVHPYITSNPQLRAQTQAQVTASLAHIKNSITRHGLEHIALSYNGGKDCLLMLVLVMAALHELYSKTVSIPHDYTLDSIFINSEELFPELLDFIKSSNEHYNANPIVIRSNLKQGFERYFNEINHSAKCIIVGVRSSDPYSSGLATEQYTDPDWPRFIRIHPILDWNYAQVWEFLIGCNLDYCSLYDEGYTSLGGTSNTIRNPFLKIEGTEDRYSPAYMLQDDADARERAGRLKK